MLIAGNHSLAFHMPASFGPDLIFQEHARGAGIDQIVDRANDIKSIAIAGIGINDNGNLDGGADAACSAHHLSLGQIAEIRQPELRSRHAVP